MANETANTTTPTVPEGKTTVAELVASGWQDVSGRKGPSRLIWRDANGRIAANATISHQGFADMELVAR